jgi:hypothetical protein
MAGSVVVRVVSNTTQARSDLSAAGQAAQNMGGDFDAADNKIDKFNEKMDSIGGHAAKVSGGLGDVGGAFTLLADNANAAAAAADAQASAALNVEKAQKSLKEAIAEYGAGSIEAREAQLALNQAQRDAKPPSGIAELGKTMETAAPLILAVAGAADLATTATNLLSASMLKNAGATIAAKAAMVGTAIATAAATVQQWALNVAMYANPIGLIIAAVLVLIGVIWLMAKNWDTISKALGKAWDWINSKAITVWDGIKTYFEKMVETFKGIFTGFIERAKKIWDGIIGIADKVKKFRDRAIGYVSNLVTKFKNLGRDIMRGLRDGIADGIKWVKDKVKGLGKLLPGWLKDVLGISSPSRVMASIGKFTMQGLTSGMESQIPKLASTVGRIGSTITGLEASPTIGVSTAGSTAGLTGVGGVTNNIYVSVSPTADKAAIGREIEGALNAYYRKRGQ